MTRDETYAYIARYTSNAFPLSITWEELKEQDFTVSMDEEVSCATYEQGTSVDMSEHKRNHQEDENEPKDLKDIASYGLPFDDEDSWRSYERSLYKSLQMDRVYYSWFEFNRCDEAAKTKEIFMKCPKCNLDMQLGWLLADEHVITWKPHDQKHLPSGKSELYLQHDFFAYTTMSYRCTSCSWLITPIIDIQST
jgi:hypothetical protein